MQFYQSDGEPRFFEAPSREMKKSTLPKLNLSLLVLTLFLISHAAKAQQTIYRCKTDDGKTIFSDSPCVGQLSGRGTQEELRVPDSRNVMEFHPRRDVRPQIQAPSRQDHPRAQSQSPYFGRSVIPKFRSSRADFRLKRRRALSRNKGLAVSVARFSQSRVVSRINLYVL